MAKETIAKATSTVSNGKSSTSTLVYEQGKSRSDLVPGHTYDINAEYVENNHYKYANGVGELRMLKCNTTITISGNQNITLGEQVTLTVTVLENQNHTLLSRGSVNIYDNNNVIQSNYTITGQNTQITFTPTQAGEHDVYGNAALLSINRSFQYSS